MNVPMIGRVFGPVPSRRLGMSLGIDPVPLKTCNHSCVYCQLGRTRRPTVRRRRFFSSVAVISEVRDVLGRLDEDAVDWITFVGSGETTLALNLGSLIHAVKALSDLPVAVITNGSLLDQPEVREELATADAVLPSLDAGAPDLFRRVNRPHRDLTFDSHIRGLVDFRMSYRGKLWVEVMLLGGVNDTPEALQEIASVLERVEPDEIHLATPTRPPAEAWVVPPTAAGLRRADLILGRVAKVLRPVPVVGGSMTGEKAVSAILAIIARHPLRETELVATLEQWVPDCLDQTRALLEESGRVQIVERHGTRFWCAAGLDYPETEEETPPGKPIEKKIGEGAGGDLK